MLERRQPTLRRAQRGMVLPEKVQIAYPPAAGARMPAEAGVDVVRV